jgi:hypothetical protein
MKIPELTEDELEHFNERAGILEFCAGYEQEEAELLAYREVMAKREHKK